MATLSDIRIAPNTRSSEYIYVDAIFINSDTLRAHPIIFDQTRLVPILERISDYKMSVVSVNGFFYQPFFSMNEPGYVQRVMLRYEPDNLEAIQFLPFVDVQIYTADQYIEYVNAAYILAFNDIVSQYNAIYGANAWQLNALLPQVAPGLVYDAPTQLFTMYADARCVMTDPNRLNIYMDISVYAQFIGLNIIPDTPNTEWNQLVFNAGFQNINLVQIGGTGPQYVKNVQLSPTISTWSNVSSLLVTSDTLTCRKEQLAISNQFGANSSSLVNNLVANFPINKTGIFDRQILYELPQLQWIDLQGNSPLYRLNFEIKYLTFDGKLLPVYIGNAGSVIVKMVFAKTIFTS